MRQVRSTRRLEDELQTELQDASTMCRIGMKKGAGLWRLDRAGSENTRPPLREIFSLALPALWRGHDRDAEIYGRGVIPMFLLRFFLAGGPLLLLGCAPAHRRIRVLTPCQHALPPPSTRLLAATPDLSIIAHAAFLVRCCSPTAGLGGQLAFKSHSAPRPPQTPAASS
jgi:hypothetical protein